MKKFSFHFNLIDEDDERIPHGNLTYIVAFLIPLIMFMALYYVREIYAFGHVPPVRAILQGTLAQACPW